jgi:hypothetical protein
LLRATAAFSKKRCCRPHLYRPPLRAPAFAAQRLPSDPPSALVTHHDIAGQTVKALCLPEAATPAYQPQKARHLRSWRVIIIRSRGEYLASVEAPDRERAEVIAIRKHARDLSQGECGSKWEDHMRSRAKLRGNRPVRNAHRVSVAYTESCSLACVSNLKTAGVAVGSRGRDTYSARLPQPPSRSQLASLAIVH